MDGWMDGCMHACMDAWMDGCMDEWMDCYIRLATVLEAILPLLQVSTRKSITWGTDQWAK